MTHFIKKKKILYYLLILTYNMYCTNSLIKHQTLTLRFLFFLPPTIQQLGRIEYMEWIGIFFGKVRPILRQTADEP